MTELNTRILKHLADANPVVRKDIEIAYAIGAEREAVVSCLHQLQDSGQVFLCNGHYRLSESAKKALA